MSIATRVNCKRSVAFFLLELCAFFSTNRRFRRYSLSLKSNTFSLERFFPFFFACFSYAAAKKVGKHGARNSWKHCGEENLESLIAIFNKNATFEFLLKHLYLRNVLNFRELDVYIKLMIPLRKEEIIVSNSVHYI